MFPLLKKAYMFTTSTDRGKGLLFILSYIKPLLVYLKVAQSYFSKVSFLFHLMNDYSKGVNKIPVETIMLLVSTKHFSVLQLPIYLRAHMVTTTTHVFFNIFQMEHFSAVKFDRIMIKIWAFLQYQKSPKKFEKMLKKSDWAFLIHVRSCSFFIKSFDTT